MTRKPSIVVDLHCHSNCSDGLLSPHDLAEKAAGAGVRYAALTDHNSIDGLAEFRRALAPTSTGFISGVELTVVFGQREVHLLGYGFNPEHPGLRRALESIRGDKFHNAHPTSLPEPLTSEAAIKLVHEAGGIVALAHPILTEPDDCKLRIMVEKLAAEDLDALEVYHGVCPESGHERLRALAVEFNLRVCGGSDYHGMENVGAGRLGVALPWEEWRSFRNTLLMKMGSREHAQATAPEPSRTAHNWRPFALQIVLPALIAVVLFALTLFALLLPRVESALLDRKREMIRELVRVARGVLTELDTSVQEGSITLAAAQTLAAARIEAMRYGAEGKDYFWIQDSSPRMIMHPYRTDLNGCDLTNIRDARGAAIFVEFSELVRVRKEGFIDYFWQWKDDPRRIEPKESYICAFEPWGWIIGTGMYVHDVHAELSKIRNNLMGISLIIVIVVLLLLVYLVRESLRIEILRSKAETNLLEANTRYSTLVKAATEGALLTRHGRCIHANPVMLELIGCSHAELELLELEDIFPGAAEMLRTFEADVGGEGLSAPIPTRLQRKEGGSLGCQIILRQLPGETGGGFWVLTRPAAGEAEKGSPSPVLQHMLRIPQNIAHDLSAEILMADSPGVIAALCTRTPQLVQSLLDNGAHAHATAGMIASISDSATEALIRLAIREMGPPPCPFSFLAMGSQGRGEQTLFTDQDNALIFLPESAADTQRCNDYFLRLATQVCEHLVGCGYKECPGKAVASNPMWCQPLDKWKACFSGWIQRSDAHELMEFSIFFDFRSVSGDASISAELRQFVDRSIVDSPRFLPQAAMNALQFRSPLRIFGNIVGASAIKEHPGCMDLKATAMPIVSYARLYAMKHSIHETNTLSRLDELERKGVLLASRRHEIATAHESLLRLRLRHQCGAIQKGKSPDNLVNPAWLGHIEEAILKECLAEIDTFQKTIRNEFLAGEFGGA